MRIIWTRSSKPLSVLIRWGLKEPISHFAIVFDDNIGGIVFHSNLLGSHIEWYPDFKKRCQVIFEFSYKVPLEMEEAVYKAILTEYYGRSYDFKAFAWMIWRGFLFRAFKRPIPKKCPFESKGGLLCTELSRALPEWILPGHLKPREGEILTPQDLYRRIEQARIIPA